MSNWTQESKRVSFSAGETVSEFASKRDAQRSGGASASSDVSVVGINVYEIPNMKSAIKTYVEGVQEHLSSINTSVDTGMAMKGTGVEEAVFLYIESVSNYCQSLVSQLLAFSDKLSLIQEAWEESDINMASKINATSDEVNSTSDVYVEKYGTTAGGGGSTVGSSGQTYSQY